MDESTSLGMLRRQNIAIDGNSPSLVHTHFGITRDTVNHRGQLRAEQEDVDAAKVGDVIECFDDGLLQNAGVQVADKLAVYVNNGAALVETVVRTRHKRTTRRMCFPSHGSIIPRRWEFR